MNKSISVTLLAEAIYTINRHAKTAPKPQHLYALKQRAIEQLLKENKAKKIGLHFTENPKKSNQYSILLVQVANYYFHIPPKQKDFKQVPHLGVQNESYRNPRSKLPLSRAKGILYSYLNWEPPKENKLKHTSRYYTPSSLGQMQWPPTKKHY